MNALALLLALTSTIVLRSGDRIVAEGEIREDRGVLTFRSAGLLYSLPAIEVERIELSEDGEATEKPVKKLRVSEEDRKRLLKELEQNHTGTPAPPQEILRKPPPPPSPDEIAELRDEERQWRRRARSYEESIRRAVEDLQLLEQQAADLQSRIHGLIALGFKPREFTYDTTQLAYTLEQLPRARLNVQRAERAYAEFREDARREGVTPGWLR